MKKRPRPKPKTFPTGGPPDDRGGPGLVRIVGGQFRGRKLKYHGDPRTRPMKDRVREAVFNLISTGSAGKQAIDLFAGTGALGLEALSRGAKRALLIEKHFPTAAVIRENVRALGVEDRTTVLPGDAFYWAQRRNGLGGEPWLVFCSPPFDFFVDRRTEMLGMLDTLVSHAPPGSIFIVESDARFDFAALPRADEWDAREYPPACVGVLKLPAAVIDSAE